jgi:phosphate starvation-inducible membrane PsiE
MGFLSFVVLCFVVVLIAWLAVLALGSLAPGHPPAIDMIIWGVAILIIVWTLLSAMGLLGHDPKIPRLTSLTV